MDKFEFKQDERFIRPIDDKDKKYRKIKYAKFEQELKNVLNDNCTLCFHGTPIWNAEKIIQSGKIQAENNKVYVSTIKNFWFTLRHHAELLSYKYPAGCIFVIEPKDKQEIKSSRENNIIGNINLKSRPDRLRGIITTPENVDKVKDWIKKSELDISYDLVQDYDNFLEFIKQKEMENNL